MRVAVVQGASRGIGLEFVRQLLARPNYAVVATCREPGDATSLRELQSSHGERLDVHQLDVTDEESIARAAAAVAEKHRVVDLCISCAGILKSTEFGLPETSAKKLSLEGMTHTFQTNAFGPMLLAKHVTPLMRQAPQPKFAAISAKVGSIADNRIGGWYSYRASKAALNMMLKCLAIETSRLRNPLTVLALHPGTTDTALSKPFQAAVPKEQLFSVDFTVGNLLRIIDGATPEQSGQLIAWNGDVLPY